MELDTLAMLGDRRATRAMLARLVADPAPAERDALLRALAAGSDPRALAPLIAIVADETQSAVFRTAVGRSFDGWEYDVVADDTWRSWWHSHDPVLRALALPQLARIDREEILAVARDAHHALHAQAIAGMGFWFEAPEHQTLEVNALAHHDPRVREAAARAWLWDEPLCAESALLSAASDADVRSEACHALAYYPSRRVLRHLASLPQCRALATAYAALGDNFLRACARPGLRAWLAPSGIDSRSRSTS
jgi:HEAT repeat protein